MPPSPGLRMRHGRAHAVAEAHAAGNALDLRAERGKVVLDEVHHPVDGDGVEGRAFGFDPGPEPRQHLVGVEGQIERVGHGRLLPRAWRGPAGEFGHF